MSLSDKECRNTCCCMYGMFNSVDVKEFIKKLKGFAYANSVEPGLIVIPTEKLDELAGDKLVGGERK